MFLFLSKLLPLFIYPLGLSCLLMVLALLTLWKYPRWTGAVISFALVILLLASSRGVAQGLVRSLLIFKRQGINVIPAPTDFLMIPSEINQTQKTWQGVLLSWIPDTLSLHQTTQALKEYIGLGVYRLRGWL